LAHFCPKNVEIKNTFFKQDPIKYCQYQHAIYKALMDRVTDEEAPNTEIVVMVLGAGRGPLVRAAMKAANLGGRKIKVIGMI
jgi:protein arginine N-methyltransferase 5